MLRFAMLRLAEATVVVVLVVTLVFCIMHLAPGDPALLLFGEATRTPEQLAEVRRAWGLDQPLLLQYLHWTANLLRGDFGESIGFGGRPVVVLLGETLPSTLQLNTLALGLSTAVAVPGGIVAALKRHSWVDRAFLLASTLGMSVPGFWLGLLAIVLFSRTLRWLPAFGQSDWKSYLLPVSILASEHLAVLARLMRSAALDVLAREYIITGRAKGLSTRRLVVDHVARNAVLPIVTIIGSRVGLLLSGTVVVETIFGWPGTGRLLFQAISQRDYPVIQAVVLLGACGVVLASVLTDLVYVYVDPRLRYR